MAKPYHPMIDLLVACEMAGKTLLKIAGELQERHNRDEDATEMQREGIDDAGNSILKSLAAYTSAATREV